MTARLHLIVVPAAVLALALAAPAAFAGDMMHKDSMSKGTDSKMSHDSMSKSSDKMSSDKGMMKHTMKDGKSDASGMSK